MTKVSKNIRRLRNARGLTQDALAEQLFVTRQTISSWENGRTQPDIETLTKLSEVFGVSVEEIIYGEKRKTDINQAKNESRKILIIIFSVIASLLVGTGLVLIFVTQWESFPLPVKKICSFLPFAAGVGCSAAVCMKKYESIAWREGTAILWCSGAAASVAMVNSVFAVDIGFENCMFADALMFLAPLYILDAVSPLIPYCGFLYYFSFVGDYYTKPWKTIVVLLMYIAGTLYVVKNSRRDDDKRHNFSVWIAALGFGSVIAGCIFSDDGIMSLGALVLVFLAYYAFDGGVLRLPFRYIGVIGSCVSTVFCVMNSEPFEYDYTESAEFASLINACGVISVVIGIAVLSFAVIYSLKKIASDRLKIAFLSCGSVLAVLRIISPLVNALGTVWLYVVVFVTAASMAGLLIADGVMKTDFFTLNAGLLTEAFLIGYMLIISEIGLIPMGLLFIALGGVLFFVNFRISKKLKSENEHKITVVTDDE